MITEFVPMYDRILVKRIQPEEKTAGGLIVPENHAEKTGTGIVVEKGDGRILANGKLRPLKVKKGNKIYFSKFAGVEVDKDHIILREDEVMGIIKEKNTNEKFIEELQEGGVHFTPEFLEHVKKVDANG